MSVTEPRPIIAPLGAVYDQARDLSWPLIRLTAGGFLLIHGLQKVFGTTIAAFAANSLARRGIEPALPMAYLVYFMETVGAVCIMLGLYTRLFAGMAVIHFIVIIVFAQWSRGFPWNGQGGGWEYPAFWGLIIIAILLRGGGPYSLDRKLGKEL
jgi:putative oxidoreductase